MTITTAEIIVESTTNVVTSDQPPPMEEPTNVARSNSDSSSIATTSESEIEDILTRLNSFEISELADFLTRDYQPEPKNVQNETIILKSEGSFDQVVAEEVTFEIIQQDIIDTKKQKESTPAMNIQGNEMCSYQEESSPKLMKNEEIIVQESIKKELENIENIDPFPDLFLTLTKNEEVTSMAGTTDIINESLGTSIGQTLQFSYLVEAYHKKTMQNIELMQEQDLIALHQMILDDHLEFSYIECHQRILDDHLEFSYIEFHQSIVDSHLEFSYLIDELNNEMMIPECSSIDKISTSPKVSEDSLHTEQNTPTIISFADSVLQAINIEHGTGSFEIEDLDEGEQSSGNENGDIDFDEPVFTGNTFYSYTQKAEIGQATTEPTMISSPTKRKPSKRLSSLEPIQEEDLDLPTEMTILTTKNNKNSSMQIGSSDFSIYPRTSLLNAQPDIDDEEKIDKRVSTSILQNKDTGDEHVAIINSKYNRLSIANIHSKEIKESDKNIFEEEKRRQSTSFKESSKLHIETLKSTLDELRKSRSDFSPLKSSGSIINSAHSFRPPSQSLPALPESITISSTAPVSLVLDGSSNKPHDDFECKNAKRVSSLPVLIGELDDVITQLEKDAAGLDFSGEDIRKEKSDVQVQEDVKNLSKIKSPDKSLRVSPKSPLHLPSPIIPVIDTPQRNSSLTDEAQGSLKTFEKSTSVMSEMSVDPKLRLFSIIPDDNLQTDLIGKSMLGEQVPDFLSALDKLPANEGSLKLLDVVSDTNTIEEIPSPTSPNNQLPPPTDSKALKVLGILDEIPATNHVDDRKALKLLGLVPDIKNHHPASLSELQIPGEPRLSNNKVMKNLGVIETASEGNEYKRVRRPSAGNGKVFKLHGLPPPISPLSGHFLTTLTSPLSRSYEAYPSAQESGNEVSIESDNLDIREVESNSSVDGKKALKILGIIENQEPIKYNSNSIPIMEHYVIPPPPLIPEDDEIQSRKSRIPNEKAFKLMGISEQLQASAPNSKSSDTASSKRLSSLGNFTGRNRSTSSPVPMRKEVEFQSMVSVNDIHDPVMCGYLSKYTPNTLIKKWKTRFFMLTSDHLYVFKSNNRKEWALSDLKIDTDTVVGKTAKKNGLEISRGMESWVLMCEDEEEMSNWIRGIRQCIVQDSFSKQALPPPPLMNPSPSLSVISLASSSRSYLSEEFTKDQLAKIPFRGNDLEVRNDYGAYFM